MRQPTSKQRRTRGLTKIRKTEIARVIRGLKAAEQPMRGIEIDPATGKFTVLIGTGVPSDDELDAWLRKKNAVLD